MFEQINKNLLLRAALILLAVLASSSVYIFGYLQKVPGSSYTGIRSMNASDFNANGAWLRQALDGNLIFRNPYTTESQKRFLVRPFYILISLPFRFFKLSPPVILHICRILFSLILLCTLFPLLRIFEKNPTSVNFAFLILAFTSGLGYFFRQIVPASADLQIPEAFLFLTLGEVPHFQYSLLLLWMGMASLFLYAQNRTWALWLFLLCLELLWWDHPFDAFTLIALSSLGLWFFEGWRKKLLFFIFMGVISTPAILYYSYLTKLSYAQGAAEQNVLPSPQLIALATSFLPIAVLSAIGAVIQVKDPGRKRTAIFLIAWITVQFVLAYTPLPFQRRLLSGVQFPLAVLAATALKEKIRNLVAICSILIIFSCTNFYIAKSQIQELQNRSMPFYLPDPYKHAFHWLSDRNQKDGVLSAFVTGNFIPAHTGMSAYWGHSQLAPNSQKRRSEVENFYRKPNPIFVRNNNIRYIFLGWEERMYLTAALQAPFSCIYNRDGIRIYELGGDSLMYNYRQ